MTEPAPQHVTIEDMSDYLVRVWDSRFEAVGEVTHGWRPDEPETICVPADSAIGQLFHCHGEIGMCAYLTVDYPGRERWSGRVRDVHFQRPFGRDMLATARFSDHAPYLAMLEGVAELVKRGVEAA